MKIFYCTVYTTSAFWGGIFSLVGCFWVFWFSFSSFFVFFFLFWLLLLLVFGLRGFFCGQRDGWIVLLIKKKFFMVLDNIKFYFSFGKQPRLVSL